jgi:hypothetical protein
VHLPAKLIFSLDYLVYLFETAANVDTRDKNVLDSLMPWSDSLPQTCRAPSRDNVIDVISNL